MSSEKHSGLRLRPDIRGQSFWIYVRTLKKAYRKDAGTEVYQRLQDAPAIAMPVVLAQLKQKNKEWRCTQHEWSHTWRQVDAHNFYKSLDYTGASTLNRMTRRRPRPRRSLWRSRACIRSRRTKHARSSHACKTHMHMGLARLPAHVFICGLGCPVLRAETRVLV